MRTAATSRWRAATASGSFAVTGTRLQRSESTRLAQAERAGVPARSEHAGVRQRPPPELHLADDVLLRHEAPVPAVGAVVAMVAHHEVVAFRHHLRAPVVVAAILVRHEGVVHRDVVAEHPAVDDPHLIALFRDYPLD